MLLAKEGEGKIASPRIIFAKANSVNNHTHTHTHKQPQITKSNMTCKRETFNTIKPYLRKFEEFIKGCNSS